MKKIMFMLVAAMFCCVLGAADYATLTREANAAKKAENMTLAEQKFAEAYNVAKEGKEKLRAATNYAKFLASVKKKDQAAQVYETELKKEIYNAKQRQSMLVNIAAMFLWEKSKQQYVLDKLNLAFSMKGVREDEILYFLMCWYASCIYSARKDFEPIITICEPAAKASKIGWHKATLYSYIGSAYNQLKMKEEAVKNYELAVQYAKTDKRYSKKDLEKLEKTLERLKK